MPGEAGAVSRIAGDWFLLAGTLDRSHSRLLISVPNPMCLIPTTTTYDCLVHFLDMYFFIHILRHHQEECAQGGYGTWYARYTHIRISAYAQLPITYRSMCIPPSRSIKNIIRICGYAHAHVCAHGIVVANLSARA